MLDVYLLSVETRTGERHSEYQELVQKSLSANVVLVVMMTPVKAKRARNPNHRR